MMMMMTKVMIKTSFFFFAFATRHLRFKEFAYSYLRVPEDVHENNNKNKKNQQKK